MDARTKMATPATFGAAAGKNLASVRRGHTCAKAMRALAMQIAGLEGSFHGSYPGNRKVLGKTKGCELRETADCTRLRLCVSIRNRVRDIPATRISALWITVALAY
jgi:hypothetical protein